MIRWKLVALLALVAATVTPRVADASLVEIQNEAVRALAHVQERRFANGMTVVVQEDRHVPIVSLALRYDAGERNVPPGREGVAMLTTYAMVRVTKHVAAGEYNRYLSRAGATGHSGSTAADSTLLRVTLPSNRLALPLWLWSDQMAFFVDAIDKAQLDVERAALVNAIANEDGGPLSRVSAMLDEEIYAAGHPYHAIGRATAATIGAITVDDVRAYHERWIVPEHATLVIVGDVVAADAFALAEKYFGPVPRGPGAKLAPPTSTPLRGESQLEISANVSTPTVWIRWPTPAFYTDDDAMLDVAARLMTGIRSGHLHWALVDEKKVATAVNATNGSRALGSRFDVRVTGVAGVTPAALLAEVDAAFGRFSDGHVTEAHVNGALGETLLPRLYSFEHAAIRAALLAGYSTNMGTPSFIDKDLARFVPIDRAALARAIPRLLPGNKRVVALVTPSSSAPMGGVKSARNFKPAWIK